MSWTHSESGSWYHPSATANQCIIAYHGLGANAQDLIPLAEQLAQQYGQDSTCILCPQAPTRQVDLFQAAVPAWYNVERIKKETLMDEKGLAKSYQGVQTWLAKYLPAVSPERFMVLGFSQGAVMALHHAWHKQLPFVTMLSGYLPALAWPNHPPPKVLWQHGRDDTVLPLAWAQEGRTQLVGQGCALTWQVYDHGHFVSPEQCLAMNAWWLERVPV